ncbi:entericidin [Crenobacter sp. SG2303]|uniref:Entericidin n=1 Tax=Crenobacter oryzisoli TaxID=3056844 RepID=A0ABT7XKI0_9NEIS|nr:MULTISPECIES: entericidin [unclassified Crenobacter]MDN0074290.1 entericidin [Crenobacter sp. SG2303]MDN0082236.1 entericidin [Crenobacter sp. SG2305]
MFAISKRVLRRLLPLAGVLLLSACNTMQGLSQDINQGGEAVGQALHRSGEAVGRAVQRGGEAVSDTAKRVGNKIDDAMRPSPPAPVVNGTVAQGN